MTEEILLTKEGYEKIVEEHDELISVKRPEIAERIKEAISYGDISENAEYDSAKNEQAELEERIQKLENMLRMAKIIDDRHVSDEVVNVGLVVEIREKTARKTQEYVIVGSAEADPFEGKISNESPLGQALLGRKKGEMVEIMTPDGINVVKIMDIRKQEEVKKADNLKTKKRDQEPEKKTTSKEKEEKKAGDKKATDKKAKVQKTEVKKTPEEKPGDKKPVEKTMTEKTTTEKKGIAKVKENKGKK